MGAKTKGRRRPTCITTAISMARDITLSVSKTATMNTIVSLAAAAFPHHAPVIFAAYIGLQYGWRAVQAYREYKELRKEMSHQRALRVEAERTALRQGIDLTTRKLDSDVKSRIENRIAILLARPEVDAAIERSLGKHVSDQTRDRFRMMLQATASQFLLGAVEGGKGKLVDEAARLFFR
ncbi:MAG: hypothetical protein WCC94_10855 [Candidatus Bathyarchaeia archaeon]